MRFFTAHTRGRGREHCGTRFQILMSLHRRSRYRQKDRNGKLTGSVSMMIFFFSGIVVEKNFQLLRYYSYCFVVFVGYLSPTQKIDIIV